MSGRDEMRHSTPGVKLTYDDFVLFPDDGKRHELIDGEHYVTPSPNRKHQAIVWNLTLVIGNYLDAHPIGRAFSAPFDVVFSDFDVVEPDLLFISKAKLEEVLTAKNVRGAPDLVVEIGSPSTRKRDETIKRKLYERSGVQEYWVIDPDLERIAVCRRTGEGYRRVLELSVEENDTLTTPLFPGLHAQLERIFKD
jgi:Uma2 family endonuclease